MTDAGELLKLLREIEAKGGPVEFDTGWPGDGDWHVYVGAGYNGTPAGEAHRSCTIILYDDSAPGLDDEWAIVGALMEDLQRRQVAPSIKDVNGRDLCRVSWFKGNPGVGHYDQEVASSGAVAAARAWLAAKGAKRVS